jgi:nitroreductase
MLLAAHAMGLGSLWFTLYEKDVMRELLGLDADKDPVALVCLGKASGDPINTPRKPLQEKIRYVR